jgi:hypothetical protein
MAGEISHAINIRIRELDDEEEDARKGKEEASSEKETEEILKINMHNLRQYSYLRHTDPEMIKDYRKLYLK